MSSRRTLALLAIAAQVLLAANAHAQFFPAPGDWTYVTRGASVVLDAAGDTGASPLRDIVRVDEAAARVFSDGTFLYFGLRVDGDPRPSGVWAQVGWGVEIDTDGDFSKYEYFVQVNGRMTQVELWQNTSGDGTPGDNAETLVEQLPITTYASVESDGSSDFFVNWAIPLADLSATASTSFRFLFGVTASASALLTTGQSSDIAGVGNSCTGCTLAALLSDPYSTPAVGVSPGPRRLASAAVRAFPNPMRTGGQFEVALPTSGTWRLSIVDLAGRTVRHLGLAGSAGNQSIAWDGTDDAGGRLRSGTYFAVLTGAGASSRRTLVLLH